jgi:hypothetical protein
LFTTISTVPATPLVCFFCIDQGGWLLEVLPQDIEQIFASICTPGKHAIRQIQIISKGSSRFAAANLRDLANAFEYINLAISKPCNKGAQGVHRS